MKNTSISQITNVNNSKQQFQNKPDILDIEYVYNNEQDKQNDNNKNSNNNLELPEISTNSPDKVRLAENNLSGLNKK